MRPGVSRADASAAGDVYGGHTLGLKDDDAFRHIFQSRERVLEHLADVVRDFASPGVEVVEAMSAHHRRTGAGTGDSGVR